MKKIIGFSLALVSAFLMSACVTTGTTGQGAELAALPQDRDGAAQFLATHPGEQWVLLVQDDGAGNALLANPLRIGEQADGVRTVWMKLVFLQPMPLSASQPEKIAGTLIYTEVQCATNTYRSSSYYAVGESGQILDTVNMPEASFADLGSNAVALSIYRLACESR